MTREDQTTVALLLGQVVWGRKQTKTRLQQQGTGIWATLKTADEIWRRTKPMRMLLKAFVYPTWQVQILYRNKKFVVWNLNCNSSLRFWSWSKKPSEIYRINLTNRRKSWLLMRPKFKLTFKMSLRSYQENWRWSKTVKWRKRDNCLSWPSNAMNWFSHAPSRWVCSWTERQPKLPIWPSKLALSSQN